MDEAPKKNKRREGAKATRARVFGPDAAARSFDQQRGGWSQTPRLAPLIAGLINDLEQRRGNAGALYLALWARDTQAASFIEVNDPTDLVFDAGFVHSQKRALRTWAERINVLIELGFVETQPKAHRDHHYVLLLEPHWAVQRLHATRGKDFPPRWYDYFVKRCEELGIALAPPLPETPPPAPDAPNTSSIPASTR